MLRQAVVETAIIVALTTLLLVLAATVGLPSRRVPVPAEAAGEPERPGSKPVRRDAFPEWFKSFRVRP